jgi:hypothetical protein
MPGTARLSQTKHVPCMCLTWAPTWHTCNKGCSSIEAVWVRQGASCSWAVCAVLPTHITLEAHSEPQRQVYGQITIIIQWQ